MSKREEEPAKWTSFLGKAAACLSATAAVLVALVSLGDALTGKGRDEAVLPDEASEMVTPVTSDAVIAQNSTANGNDSTNSVNVQEGNTTNTAQGGSASSVSEGGNAASTAELNVNVAPSDGTCPNITNSGDYVVQNSCDSDNNQVTITVNQ